MHTQEFTRCNRPRRLSGFFPAQFGFALLIWLGTLQTWSAPGDPDPSFNPPQITGGLPTSVFAITIQPDGKILLGGNFTRISGTLQRGVARLNADGTLDTTFSPTNVPPDIRAIAVEASGGILLGVGTPSTSEPAMLRLGSDGTTDQAFANSSRSGATPRGVWSILTQEDGNILAGGGTPSSLCLRRLLPNGLADTTFPPNYGSEKVEAMAFGTDGRIFAAGGLAAHRGIARLETNGLPAPFVLGVPLNFVAHTLAVQPDGLVIAGGQFSNVGSVSRTNIVRFSPGGQIDVNFNAGIGPNGEIRSLVLDSNNRIIVGGNFSTFNRLPSAGVARLEANGALDIGYNSAAGVGLADPVLALQSDGSLLVGGASTDGHPIRRLLGVERASAAPTVVVSPSQVNLTIGQAVTFTAFASSAKPVTYQWSTNGVAINKATNATLIFTNITTADSKTYTVTVKNSSGTAKGSTVLNVVALSPRVGKLDPTYNTATRAQVMDGIFALALQPDGGAFLGGGFRSFNGVPRTNLVRVDALGNVDTNFLSVRDESGPFPDWVQAVVSQPDGKILCGGRFPRHFVRLEASGVVDGSGLGFFETSPVYALALQSDGCILVGGSGVSRRMTNGTFDNSFSGWRIGTVKAIVVQEDGKIVVGGEFTNWQGRPAIVRLMPDGTIDESFNAQMPSGAKVAALLVQPDGKLLVGGSFQSAGGATRKGLARLNLDGSADLSFDIGSGFSSQIPVVVAALAQQSDGKVFVVGGFTSVAGVRRPGLVRLNPDGKVDPTFNTGLGLDGPVYTLALQPNGDVIIAGDFNHVDGHPQDRLARLFGDHPAALPPLLTVTSSASGLNVTFPSEIGRVFTLEFIDALDAAQWKMGASSPGNGETITLSDPNGAFADRFYRVRVE
jgi:uncharacterized delta-60 repeat protein